MVALLVILLVAMVLLIDWGVRVHRKRRGLDLSPRPRQIPLPEWAVIPLAKLRFPAGLFYSRGHTWARIAPDGVLRIGIDDLINHALGPIDRVKFLPEGSRVQRGEPLAQLWQGDRAVWVRSPATGRVQRVNHGVDSHALQADPYGPGWLAEVDADDPASDLATLTVGNKVRRWIESEALRFGRFLAGRGSRLEIATMQDGGVLLERKLAALGPEWAAAFERNFLHTE